MLDKAIADVAVGAEYAYIIFIFLVEKVGDDEVFSLYLDGYSRHLRGLMKMRTERRRWVLVTSPPLLTLLSHILSLKALKSVLI